MRAKIGDIVIYHTTEQDRQIMRDNPNCNVSNHLPAIVVANWTIPSVTEGSQCLNLNVILDGQGFLWKTSINMGEDEFNWSWDLMRPNEAHY